MKEDFSLSIVVQGFFFLFSRSQLATALPIPPFLLSTDKNATTNLKLATASLCFYTHDIHMTVRSTPKHLN
jgi:hypothetical protein